MCTSAKPGSILICSERLQFLPWIQPIQSLARSHFKRFFTGFARKLSKHFSIAKIQARYNFFGAMQHELHFPATVSIRRTRSSRPTVRFTMSLPGIPENAGGGLTAPSPRALPDTSKPLPPLPTATLTYDAFSPTEHEMGHSKAANPKRSILKSSNSPCRSVQKEVQFSPISRLHTFTPDFEDLESRRDHWKTIKSEVRHHQQESIREALVLQALWNTDPKMAHHLWQQGYVPPLPPPVIQPYTGTQDPRIWLKRFNKYVATGEDGKRVEVQEWMFRFSQMMQGQAKEWFENDAFVLTFLHQIKRGNAIDGDIAIVSKRFEKQFGWNTKMSTKKLVKKLIW